jgi:hypothetical protein
VAGVTTRPLIVLAHIFNEEFLLPHWLRHHTRMFDHGVVVDRGSTDASMEIVRTLAPDWEIVRSRTDVFDARECDYEMMDLESRYDGWKVVLNATEFVFHPTLDDYVAAFESEHPEADGVGMRTVVMVDRPEDRGAPVTDEPLVLQRFHGFPSDPGSPQAYRFMHRAHHGDYGVGRHTTGLRVVPDPDLLILRFSWSPYEHLRERKLQIAAAIPETDLKLKLSWQHMGTADDLDRQFADFAARARDLRTDDLYGRTLEQLAESLAAPRARPRRRVERRAAGRVRDRVAILTTAKVKARGAGSHPERELTITGALAEGHTVRLASMSRAKGSSATFEVETVDPAGAKALAKWGEILVADCAALQIASLGGYPRPLVVDLAGALPLGRKTEWVLLRGDTFLCADAEEHEIALEQLAAAGRLDERLGADDPRAPALLSLVPPRPGPADVATIVAFCRRPQRPPGNLLSEADRRLMSSQVLSTYRKRYQDR